MKPPDFHDELLFCLTYSQKIYMINGGFTLLIKFNQHNKAVHKWDVVFISLIIYSLTGNKNLTEICLLKSGFIA